MRGSTLACRVHLWSSPPLDFHHAAGGGTRILWPALIRFNRFFVTDPCIFILPRTFGRLFVRTARSLKTPLLVWRFISSTYKNCGCWIWTSVCAVWGRQGTTPLTRDNKKGGCYKADAQPPEKRGNKMFSLCSHPTEIWTRLFSVKGWRPSH